MQSGLPKPEGGVLTYIPPPEARPPTLKLQVGDIILQVAGHVTSRNVAAVEADHGVLGVGGHRSVPGAA